MRIIIVFLVLVTNLYGQAYYEDGMKWNQSTIELDRISIFNQLWEVEGDTVIDRYLYKMVDLKYEYVLIDPKFDTVKVREVDFLRGERLIRQEGKKVYQRVGDSEEKILYDFGLEKGDTAFFDFNAQNSGFIVDSIGRYYNGADTLNVFFMEDRRFWLYEGVGWQSGIFSRPTSFSSRRQNVLHCFKYRGFINIWENEWGWLYDYFPDIESCDQTSFTTNEKEAELLVAPNPSNGTVIVRTDKAAEYVIHSLNGKSVERGQLRPGSNNIDLPPGIYFLSVQINGERTNKMVVVR